MDGSDVRQGIIGQESRQNWDQHYSFVGRFELEGTAAMRQSPCAKEGREEKKGGGGGGREITHDHW